MNISILGLSGQENERGPEGVGKSCLCNRIVRPSADEYSEQHLWLLSSSDFNSRVVNSDHFLYWGTASVDISGCLYSIGVIEQTEFIHDETLRPFPNPQPYAKRALALRLKSLDKFAYFSKFQLGFEDEYPVHLMPSEVTIDGFIFCYDASFRGHAHRENQDRLLCKVSHELHKIPKPLVIAVTKMDSVHVESLTHLYELINSYRYLKSCTVVEISAKLNINVAAVISAIVTSILKLSGSSKQRIIKFGDAYAKQTSADQQLTESYQNFLQHNILNWFATWATCDSFIQRSPIYRSFVERFGKNTAKSMFELHVNYLCSETAKILVRQWLCDLPHVFETLLSDWNEFGECLEADSVLSDSDLSEVFKLALPKLSAHARFSAYFQNQQLFSLFVSFPNSNGQKLLELVRTDKRIPVDILDFPEAFEVFRNTFRSLRKKKVLENLRHELKKTLESDLEYSPGMKHEESLVYVRSIYGQRFKDLDENDLLSAFDEVQRVLADNAILDLRNLIEQNCADIVFDSSTFLDVAVDKAERTLSSRTRYRRCDRLPQLRTQVFRDWLVAARSGDSRKCPNGLVQYCMASRLRNALSRKPASSPRRFGVVLVGTQKDARVIANAVKESWPDGILKVETQSRSSSPPTQLRVDIVRHGQSLPTTKETHHTASRSLQRADALVFLVSGDSSFRTTQSSLEAAGSVLKLTAPKVVCLLPSDSSEETDLYPHLRMLAEASSAESVDCRYAMTQLCQAISRLAVAAVQRVASSCSSRSPDVKIAFFCRCADLYSTDLVVGPLLRGSCFHLDPSDDHLPNCVCVVRQHLFLDSFRKTVQILLLPYHARANPSVFRVVEKVHGVILAFDPSNPRSFANMAAEANRRAGTPVFILAVDEPGGVDSLYANETTRNILNDAASLGDRLAAHFVKTTSGFADQPAVYTPFFRVAYEKREQTEQVHALFELSRRLNPPTSPSDANKAIKVNSLGRSSHISPKVKESASLNRLGLVLPSPSGYTPRSSRKEKLAKKPSPTYQSQDEPWSIVEHPVDSRSGASLPVVALIEAIEASGGLTYSGIYRVPGSSANSQQLLGQLRTAKMTSENILSGKFDVPTLATTLKAVLSRSCIFNDALALSLLELFSKESSSSGKTGQPSVDAVAKLLSAELPRSPHRQTLVCLFGHLAKVASNQPDTMNAQNLARVFWPSLLRNLTQAVDNLEQVTRLQSAAESALVFIIESYSSVMVL